MPVFDVHEIWGSLTGIGIKVGEGAVDAVETVTAAAEAAAPWIMGLIVVGGLFAVALIVDDVEDLLD